MKKINLLWIIPLTLFIGWTIGFYVGIPKHITIDTTDKTIGDINQLLDKAINATDKLPSCSYINTTIYADYGYGEYTKLLSEIKKFNNDVSYRNILIEVLEARDLSCNYNERNPIIDNILNPSNKTFCVWNGEPFACSYSERDIRDMVNNLKPLEELCLDRWD